MNERIFLLENEIPASGLREARYRYAEGCVVFPRSISSVWLATPLFRTVSFFGGFIKGTFLAQVTPKPKST